MKKFWNVFFVTLGVIFSLIIIVLGYIYVTDTFGIKSLIKGDSSSNTTSETTTDKNPLIPDAQEKVLENIGVDTSALPTEITPEMLACFDLKLGKARTDEIRNGSSITPIDYAKGESCL